MLGPREIESSVINRRRKTRTMLNKKTFFSLLAGKMDVGQYIHQHYMRFIRIVNTINKLLETDTNKETIKILDFASHTGVLGILLKTFGYDIYCIDLDQVIQGNLGNYTKNDLKVQCLNNNWDKLPYLDNYFDCLVFSEVLEHLYESPIKYLEEFFRILRPNGYLIITTPNVMRIENKIKFLFGINIYQDIKRYCYNPRYTLHFREYSKKDLQTLLGEYLNYKNIRLHLFDYLGGRTKFRRFVQKTMSPLNSIFPMFKSCFLVVAQKK